MINDHSLRVWSDHSWHRRLASHKPPATSSSSFLKTCIQALTFMSISLQVAQWDNACQRPGLNPTSGKWLAKAWHKLYLDLNSDRQVQLEILYQWAWTDGHYQIWMGWKETLFLHLYPWWQYCTFVDISGGTQWDRTTLIKSEYSGTISLSLLLLVLLSLFSTIAQFFMRFA